MAGIQALVNQVNGKSQGNPNYVYYKLAAKEYGTAGNASCKSTLGRAIAGTCIFYDVTLGDMDVPCTLGAGNCYKPSGVNGVLSTSDSSYLPAYGAAVGWDFATGIGTVNAYNLVTNWKSVAALSSTPESTFYDSGKTRSVTCRLRHRDGTPESADSPKLPRSAGECGWR